MPARHRDTTSSGRENHRMKGTGAGLPEHIQTNNAAGGPTPSQTLVFLTGCDVQLQLTDQSLPQEPGEPSTVSVTTNEDGLGDQRPKEARQRGHVVDPKAKPGWDECF
ncbi:hypothetical protein PtB15_3B357 [Puccinia triticina]|nr:hypothetical protein PtB15_3B357 [Puccinia triticina]